MIEQRTSHWIHSDNPHDGDSQVRDGANCGPGCDLYEPPLPEPGDDGVTPEEVDEEMASAGQAQRGWATRPIRVIIVGTDGRAWANAVAEVAIFDGAMHLVVGEAIDVATPNEAAWAQRATADLR